ncbi:MAG: rhodanese-related sulfurtransferase [Pseudohongiellaceae bacterium]|jgi:rhodanese-related sulfurtransferase
MSFESLEPTVAHERMGADAASVFLDVRTVEEFDRGHPTGAINIPWAERDATGGMTPNPAFNSTIEKHYGKTSKLFLSCQGGVRSVHACNQLEAAGFAGMTNVDGGFGGRRGPAGDIVCTGWQANDLPVEATPSTYEELKS